MEKPSNQKTIDIDVHSNWKGLDMLVLELKDKQNTHPGFFEYIDKKPFKKESIDKIISEGVGLMTLDMALDGATAIYKGKKVIAIRKSLKPYERDKTLFHELMHLWHGHYSYDREYHDSVFYHLAGLLDRAANAFGPNSAIKHELFYIENAIITEWLARQMRAQPDLLRSAINSFGLEQYIYDRASAQAFHPAFNEQRQLLFDFGKEHYEDLRKEYLKMPVLMD